MGDHHSHQLGRRSKRLTDALHQLDPMLKLQIRTIQIGELLHLNLSQLLELRQLLEQFRSRHRPRGVGVEGGAFVSAASDRAARGKQEQLRG